LICATLSTLRWRFRLDGVQEKLERGAKVADVGCCHGASTIIMAGAFPESEFFGFDCHAPSIERAQEATKDDQRKRKTRRRATALTRMHSSRSLLDLGPQSSGLP